MEKIDYWTGEILDLDWFRWLDLEREKSIKRGYVEPLDISNIKNSNDLVRYNYNIYRGKALKLPVMDLGYSVEEMNSPEFRLVTLIADKLIFHSFAILDKVYIGRKLKWGDKMVRKTFNILKDKNIIVIHDISLDNKNERLVELHPFHGWVGYSPMRNNSLKQWVFKKQ